MAKRNCCVTRIIVLKTRGIVWRQLQKVRDNDPDCYDRECFCKNNDCYCRYNKPYCHYKEACFDYKKGNCNGLNEIVVEQATL